MAAVDAAAAGEGIAPGMTLADARALRPDLAVAEADPTADAAALARLAAWCGRYSPWSAPDGADGVWLDVTGCAHLRGGEAALAAEVVARLGRQGVACRAAIADTAGAAWAVARHGGKRATVVPPGEVRGALADLPVVGLRLDPVVAAGLVRLGLRRIGELLAVPRADLAGRFGAAVAYRLDQALGAAPEPLSPVPPALARWTRCRFAEPIAAPESLAAATRALLDELCCCLAAEDLGARRLELMLYRVDGTAAPLLVGTARPSRDPRHLLRLLEERLGEVDLGLGIEDMRLAATVVEGLAPAQLRLAPWRATPRPPDPATVRLARSILEAEGKGRGDGEDEHELAILVDRLANRLGPEALGRLLPRQSHLPERAARFAPGLAAAAAGDGWDGARLRPVRLLSRPEPIEAVAVVPDDPPVQFHWRRRAHRVRRADGPERIAGEWWRGMAEAGELRDYYRVEDVAGRRFWLYRAGLYRPERPPRWFLHGVFA